jgi:hypothetical protein
MKIAAWAGERDAAVSPPRSRFSLRRRGDHHWWNEHRDGSNRAAVTMAERLRGASHRLDPARVPGSRDRGERGGPAPRPDGLHRVLHALAHTSRPRQGRSDHTPDLTPVGWARCRHTGSRRPAPALRSHRRIAIARRRYQTKARYKHPPVEPSVLMGCCGCPHSSSTERNHKAGCRAGVDIACL